MMSASSSYAKVQWDSGGGGLSAQRQGRVAWGCYFLLGAGFLAPWNAFLTATDFFETLFPGAHVDRVFTVCYLPACLLLLIITVVLTHPLHPLSQASGTGPAAMEFAEYGLLRSALGNGGWAGSGGRWRLCSVRRCCLQVFMAGLPSPRVRICGAFVGFAAAMAAVPLLVAAYTPDPSSSTPGASGGHSLSASASTAPASALNALMAVVVAVGAMDGLCQGAVFGDAAQLPPTYTQAVVAGTASSGLLVCLIRIATKLAWDSDAAPGSAQHLAALHTSSTIYFAIAGVLSLVCLVTYQLVLPRLHLVHALRGQGAGTLHGSVQLHVDASTQGEAAEDAERAAGGKASYVAACIDPMLCAPTFTPPEAPEAAAAESSPLLLGAAGGVTPQGQLGHALSTVSETGMDISTWDGRRGSGEAEADTLLTPVGHHAVTAAAGSWPSNSSSRWTGAPGSHLSVCWAALWPLCVSLVLTYTATLSIFPGFLAEDVHSAALGEWYAILLITAFNAADFLGKLLEGWSCSCGGSYSPSHSSSHAHAGAGCERGEQGGTSSQQGNRAETVWLMWASLVRGLLAVGAFLAAATLGAPPWVMGALTLALGASNGWLTSAAMTRGTALLPPALHEVGEGVLVVALVVGLLVGACAGWLWLLVG